MERWALFEHKFDQDYFVPLLTISLALAVIRVHYVTVVSPFRGRHDVLI